MERLKSQLLQRKITKERFRLECTVNQAKDMLTASYMAEVEYRRHKYNPLAEEYISKAAEWLVAGERFGLLMCGLTGNGKTTLMLAILSLINYFDLRDDYNNELRVKLIDARELVRLNKDNYQLFRTYRNAPMLAIDDIGTEPAEVLDYGNVLSPIVDVLSYRYNEQLFTLATTNLGPKDIRNKYKDRIADRFNEMMEKLIFTNHSYRV